MIRTVRNSASSAAIPSAAGTASHTPSTPKCYGISASAAMRNPNVLAKETIAATPSAPAIRIRMLLNMTVTTAFASCDTISELPFEQDFVSTCGFTRKRQKCSPLCELSSCFFPQNFSLFLNRAAKRIANIRFDMNQVRPASRSFRRILFSARETCTCVMPSAAATCICVQSSK